MSDKKVIAAYRLICPECTQCIDVPRNQVTECSGIGAGRDYDGGYDSGYSVIKFKCPKCDCQIVKGGTIESNLGKTMFKVAIT